MPDNYTSRYGCLSKHQQGKTWWFDSREERDAFAANLEQNGFEARHGVYKWDHDKPLVTPFDLKHGNHWY